MKRFARDLDEDELLELYFPRREQWRPSNGDAEQNRLRNRIDRLPPWMRAIELLFWGLGSIGGGT